MVYAMLLMHRVNQVVGANLHEAQCGFRFSRGTVDAMFVLRQLSNATQCNKGIQLHLAFIDLTKAYNWVNRDALWCILRVYRIPSKIVELLEDLHIGMLAMVRLGGTWDRSSWWAAGCARVALWRPYCSTYSWTLW